MLALNNATRLFFPHVQGGIIDQVWLWLGFRFFSGFGSRVLGPGSRVQGIGYRVQSPGSRVQGL
eukprot:2608943-Rhodomonas_salina.2